MRYSIKDCGVLTTILAMFLTVLFVTGPLFWQNQKLRTQSAFSALMLDDACSRIAGFTDHHPDLYGALVIVKQQRDNLKHLSHNEYNQMKETK